MDSETSDKEEMEVDSPSKTNKSPAKRSTPQKAKSSPVKSSPSKTNKKAQSPIDTGSDESGSESEEAKPKPGLFDLPVELSGTRDRKKVERLSFVAPPAAKTLLPGEGRGVALNDLDIVEANLQKEKSDDLKLLHRLLFNRAGNSNEIKKNIRKFNGFSFTEDSVEATKKKTAIDKFTASQTKSILRLLDLPVQGNKDEISKRLFDFLMEPVDSGRKVPQKKKPAAKGKPVNSRKRPSSKARNSKSKSRSMIDKSDDEEESEASNSDDEKQPKIKAGTKLRDQKKARKRVVSESEEEERGSGDGSDIEEVGKQVKKKPDSKVNKKKAGKMVMSENEEEEEKKGVSGGESDKEEIIKPGKRGRKQPNYADPDSEESDRESGTNGVKIDKQTKHDANDIDDSNSDDEMVGKSKPNVKKGKRAEEPPKQKPTNSKSTASANQAKANGTTARATNAESAKKRKRSVSDSSDDAPLAKLKKPAPPTEEELKKCIVQLLEGANLDEITMKTVFKQVQSKYPDCDLSGNKQFIKVTVKSLI